MTQTAYRQGPDAQGMFGQFGGRYVAETLMPLILDLQREYDAMRGADNRHLDAEALKKAVKSARNSSRLTCPSWSASASANQRPTG